LAASWAAPRAGAMVEPTAVMRAAKTAGSSAEHWGHLWVVW